MFHGCSLLKELNLYNFSTDKVVNMRYMFHGCSSLKELNLSNFNTINVTNYCMLNGCSEQLKMKMKSEKKFKEEAFE